MRREKALSCVLIGIVLATLITCAVPDMSLISEVPTDFAEALDDWGESLAYNGDYPATSFTGVFTVGVSKYDREHPRGLNEQKRASAFFLASAVTVAHNETITRDSDSSKWLIAEPPVNHHGVVTVKLTRVVHKTKGKF